MRGIVAEQGELAVAVHGKVADAHRLEADALLAERRRLDRLQRVGVVRGLLGTLLAERLLRLVRGLALALRRLVLGALDRVPRHVVKRRLEHRAAEHLARVRVDGRQEVVLRRGVFGEEQVVEEAHLVHAHGAAARRVLGHPLDVGLGLRLGVVAAHELCDVACNVGAHVGAGDRMRHLV